MKLPENVKLVDNVTYDFNSPIQPINVIKPLKRAPGLGRLNRLIATSIDLLVAKGHDNKRFKRDYANGVAMYKCPSCNAVGAVGLGQARGETHAAGDAFENNCTKQK